MRRIEHQSFDEERSLYHSTDLAIVDCRFEGPADGESALKESSHIVVSHSSFVLRYPLWHVSDFTIQSSCFKESARAPIWYSKKGKVSDSELKGPKMLRECDDISFSNCKINSAEFGWNCRSVSLSTTVLQSEYAFLNSENINAENLSFSGKYAFQYTKNLVIRNSVLDTKDAFWESENVLVENSVIGGEYLGWYSRNLTLINCRICGTQPLCYCKNLVLKNCTMQDCDLSFEYSEVDAEIQGKIDSVKNPKSGSILADSYGDIILNNSVYPTSCQILTKNS